MGAGPSSSIQTRSPNLRPWMSRGSEMYRWAATKGRSLGLRAGDGAEFLTVRCQKRRPLGLRGVRSAHARPMQRRQHPLAAGLHAGSRQHLRHALRCLLVGRQLQVVLVALNHLGQGRPARGVGWGDGGSDTACPGCGAISRSDLEPAVGTHNIRRSPGGGGGGLRGPTHLAGTTCSPLPRCWGVFRIHKCSAALPCCCPAALPCCACCACCARRYWRHSGIWEGRAKVMGATRQASSP